MKLTGSYKLGVKKELVWKALNDANVLMIEVFEEDDNED